MGAIKFWDWFKYRVGIITAALAVLSLNEWAVIIGILCTVVTCLVNWYYERKKIPNRFRWRCAWGIRAN
nr:HP1 family phage holin [Klebsiella pneumoniae]